MRFSSRHSLESSKQLTWYKIKNTPHYPVILKTPKHVLDKLVDSVYPKLKDKETNGIDSYRKKFTTEKRRGTVIEGKCYRKPFKYNPRGKRIDFLSRKMNFDEISYEIESITRRSNRKEPRIRMATQKVIMS